MLLSGRGGTVRTGLLVIAAAGLLAGCAETQFVTSTTKELRQATQSQQPNQIYYKIGKPYQVQGVWYYPREDYGYDETGIASWYGPDFQGKRTADGEVFNMNDVTAAHQTLPLPSIVRVTNLQNGRSLLVRVNDRGPFVNGRIIDVSRRTAQLLGFETAGTAKVRVQIVADESRALAASLPRDPSEHVPAPKVAAVPRAAVTAQALPPPPGAQAAPAPSASRVVTADNAGAPSAGPPGQIDGVAAKQPVTGASTMTVVPVKPSNIYIQAGAFSQIDNANRLRARLSPLGETRVTPVFVGDQQLFRVRLGPVATVDEADKLLQSVINAGYKDAQLIVAK